MRRSRPAPVPPPALPRPGRGVRSGRPRGAALPLLAGLLAAGVIATALAVLPARNVPAADPPPPAAQPIEPPIAAGPPCAPIVGAMSVRQRLAQRLMVGVDAADPAATAELVRSSQVGGVFLGGNATALLRDGALARVQEAASVPVWVAVDDEGGRVQRIDDLDGELPSAARMAATMTPEQVRALARARGEQLKARGVTTDLAPVVDLGGQPRTAVIGDRAFSTDPATVTRYAGAFAAGLRDAGVLPVFKHFPGHGRADGDSHKGRVSTPPIQQLRAADLRPYSELLPAGTAAVMVGHLDVPGLTSGLPTSLTPATYALLRGELGFDGVVMTDDLGAMKAVTGRFGLADAVRTALDAGADMALWSNPAPPATVLDDLEAALARGELDAAENDRAVTRILIAKGRCAA